MAATVRVSSWHGASGSQTATHVDSEGGGSGIKFSLDDSESGTTNIQIPTSTGTDYSWSKWLSFNVTATSTTALTNRRVYNASAQATGIHIYYLTTPTSTYAQPASIQADSTSSNNAVPSNYTELTATTYAGSFQFDNASGSTGSTGVNGKYLTIQLGVGSDYAGGGNASTSLQSLKMAYDEA
jgi:hypothetical protein